MPSQHSNPYADPVRGALASGPCRRGVSFVASVLDVCADESHQSRRHHGNRFVVGARWSDSSGAYRESPPGFDDRSRSHIVIYAYQHGLVDPTETAG